MSRQLGLYENEDKAKLWPADEAAARVIDDSEEATKSKSPYVGFLGYELGVGPPQANRTAEARRRLTRIAALPAPKSIRNKMVAQMALPVAAYGWFSSPSAKATSAWTMCVQEALRLARHAGRPLSRLVCGHSMALECSVALRHINATTKRLHNGLPVTIGGVWHRRCIGALRRLGATTIGGWGFERHGQVAHRGGHRQRLPFGRGSAKTRPSKGVAS